MELPEASIFPRTTAYSDTASLVELGVFTCDETQKTAVLNH